MSKCSTYHHGDLRNALIMAAVELIEENGSTEFAIADTARHAGVSAAAPYRHFRDRNDLLEAVSELYFIGLGEAMAETVDAHPFGSRESILALGHMYIDYVLSRGAFYHLAWVRGKRADQEGHENENQRPGFHTFIGAVDAWCKKQQLRAADRLDLGLKIWGLAHGLAVLQMNGQMESFLPGADIHTMLESSANTFLDGVEQKSQASMPPPGPGFD